MTPALVPALVMDTSVPLAAILPGPRAEEAGGILGLVAGRGALVPAHWHLELAGSLLAAERRGVLGAAERAAALAHVAALPVLADGETPARAWGASLGLARDYGLAVADAAYLELALRRGLPLASFDPALVRAAELAGARVRSGQQA